MATTKSKKEDAPKAADSKSGAKGKAQTKKTGNATESFRGREDKELRFEAEKLRKEYFDIRFKAVAEAMKSPARLGEIRKQIARIETVLSERKHGIRGQASR